MKKEYRYIKNSKDYYACSDGFIYRKIDNTYRPLKKSLTSYNQIMCCITSKKGERNTKYYRRVIAEAFNIPNPNNYKHIKQKDGDIYNTKPENLEYTEMVYGKPIISKNIDNFLRMKIGSWVSMCHNPKNPFYKDNKKRKVCVCKEWREDTLEFVKWAARNNYKKEIIL